MARDIPLLFLLFARFVTFSEKWRGVRVESC